jgi:hypothetical protein
MHPDSWEFTRSPCAQPQARPTQQVSFLIALHRRIIWSSSQLSVRRRPSLHSSSVSDRNHKPISVALSQVCVLEDVSHSCNHQHRVCDLKTLLQFFLYGCIICFIVPCYQNIIYIHHKVYNSFAKFLDKQSCIIKIKMFENDLQKMPVNVSYQA